MFSLRDRVGSEETDPPASSLAAWFLYEPGPRRPASWGQATSYSKMQGTAEDLRAAFSTLVAKIRLRFCICNYLCLEIGK